MRKDIIQSKTEPNKSDIWLSEEGLKKYGKDGWELLGGGVSPNTPIANEIQGDNLIPINQSGKNKAVSVEQIKNKVLELPSKYEFIDLGLPSGTKWATCNIGANRPEESGLYFAWGEIEGYTAEDVAAGKKAFSWDDYKFGTKNNITKYTDTDGLTQLELVDDAAYQSDNTCRMPTYDECEELIDNTTSTWETLNGINGRRFISKTNGNSIFIPASGEYRNGSVDGVGSDCALWNNYLLTSFSKYSWCLYFQLKSASMGNTNRSYGHTIRPVQPANIPTTINLNELKDKVDNTEPYVWDGTTISETIYNELLRAALNFRDIIVTAAGYLTYRLIGSTYISNNLCLTFCNTYSSPNYTFVDYYVTPNSVEIKSASIYHKRDLDSTNLHSAFYTNPGLITEDTTLTYRGTISTARYEGQFHFGDTVYTITFPNKIKWSTDSILDYKPNHTYQFRIIKGFGVMKEFANA